jgi:uncharacterized repeat protein (TIGR03803 family)
MLNISQYATAAFAIIVAIPLEANAGSFTTLYKFSGGLAGGYPSGPLLYHDGELYGTLPAYDANISYLGNVFKVNATTGRYKILHAFQGGTDGLGPRDGVIYVNGMLYGTTAWGGGGCTSPGCGTIFSIDPKTDAETVLYSFSQGPIGPAVLVYQAGPIYGITYAGGANGDDGSAFTFNPSTKSFTTLFNFGGASGINPNPQLIYENGLFYGTTAFGGKGCTHFDGCGTVFTINPSTGAESVLHAFKASTEGVTPNGDLIYHAGSLFGDTAIGGNKACRYGCGVSFKMKAATGDETVLEEFESRGENYTGATAVAGSAYETLPNGGSAGFGQLIKVDLKTGKQTVLYTLGGGSDGSDPGAPLTYHDGTFYGTTDGGNGTVFKYVP